MKQNLPERSSLPAGKEPLHLEGTYRTKYRGFAAFLICCALLLAAFSISAIWMRADGGGHDWGSFWGAETTVSNSETETEPTPPSDTVETAAPSVPEIPATAIPVCIMDLTYPSLGREYIHNETVYRPNVSALLERDVSQSKTDGKPLVLILHTHTSESYLPPDTDYLTEEPGNVTYSADPEKNVLAVGEVLCRVLNQNGVPAIHCKDQHDTPTFGGSYDRSEESIRRYLETYPSIQYVIDLHRDAVMTREGAFVRAMTEVDGEQVAQVMAVIGTDGNGTAHARWEENLALALQLREELNADGSAICRPVSLRNASFHQELAPYSILLEIGTGANSLEEAKRAAELVGQSLADLILS